MKNKKILFVGNTMWSMFRFRKNIIVKLINEGYQVYVAASPDQFEERLHKIGCEVLPVKFFRQSLNPFLDCISIFQLWSLYKKIRPTLIFHYTIKPNIYGSLVSYFFLIPSICVVTGSGYAFFKAKFILSIIKRMYQIAFHCTQQVWFLNQEDQNKFINLSIVAKEKTGILPGEGIDLKYFQPSAKKRNKTKYEFLFIGRLIPEKGIYEYIDAIKVIQNKYPTLRFGVLGTFDKHSKGFIRQEDFTQKIKDINIIYLGEHEDVRPFIEDSACIVLPSYHKEGIPRVLLEASAMMCPMITTNVPGCHDVVYDNKNGYLCQPKNSIELARKMEKMISLSSQAKKKMGEWGRKNVQQKFSDEIIIDRYIKAIKGIKLFPR